MKINRNQKSVLTLIILLAAGLLISAPPMLFDSITLVIWIVLGLWFYGVRDKKKPN